MDDATCVDCADWFGICLSAKREKRSRLNRLVSIGACSDFKPRRGQTLQDQPYSAEGLS